MKTIDLDVTDPARLEAALEAIEVGTPGYVTTSTGEEYLIHRVSGGWHLPGDLTVTGSPNA